MQNPLSVKNTTSKKFYQLISQIYNDTAKTSSIKEALEKLVNVTARLLRCERGTIFINDPVSGELYSFIAQGDLHFEIRILNNSGLAGWVFTHNDPLCIEDVESDDRHNNYFDKVTGFRTKNVLCVPFKNMNNELIGVTQMLNKAEGGFTELDIKIVQALTKHVAMAIQSKLTVEKIEAEHTKNTRFLNTISNIFSEINLSTLLEKIIDTVKMALDAERATLFINDEQTQELYTESVISISKEEIRFPNTLGIAGISFTTGDIINIPHAYADLRFNPSFDKKTGFFTRSILTVPVLNKNGAIIGVTQILNKRTGEFNTDDETQLMAINSQISIAIENAKLFDEIKTIKNYNESILESMSNAVITLNSNNQIATCNRAGMNLFQLRNLEELLHKNVSLLFPADINHVVEKINQVNNEASILQQESLMDVTLGFWEE